MIQEFNEDDITRRSNLELNDSISCYRGYGAQQNPNAYKVFYDFLNRVKPKRILEIGTGMGGFTCFLRLCSLDLEIDVDIVSYDIHSHCKTESTIKNNIDVRIKNVFNSTYTDVDQEIIDYIKQDGITIVLCDGGYKKGEFNTLSPIIKSGDYILAHDYASDETYFHNNVYEKLWNWLEIQDSDINDVCEEYNLSPFMSTEFQSAVWVCKIKN